MSKRNDISQLIRKYLNGELDAHAMHQLEKEAQNDPFLMEALEGYESFGIDQQKNLDDMNARLQARINKHERRIIPWRTISIAASVLIMLTVGGLFIKHYRPAKKTNTAVLLNKEKTPPADTNKLQQAKNTVIAENMPKRAMAKTAPAKYEPTPREKQKVVAEQNPQADADIATSTNPGVVYKDTVKLAEVKVTGYAAQRKISVVGSVQAITPDTIDKNKVTFEKGLSGKVAGVSVNKLKNSSITGFVKGQDDGLPIPGATVKIKGSATGTVTDANGKFTLNSVPGKAVLDVAFIGYNSKEVKLKTANPDSLVIAMQPNSQSLNEVVVVGYGTRQQEYQAARPENGWSAFKKYLKDHAVSPDGKVGTVKLSFTVNTDNTLSDFKILKSVSAKTDSAAIDLVNDGPGWLRNSDNKPEKVKLRIKFTVN